MYQTPHPEGVGREPPRPDDLPLLPQHLADLRASGLSDEQIARCGFYSIADPERVRAILRWKGTKVATTLGPCLAIPFTAPDGSPCGYTRLKPDTPRMSKRGDKPVKYEAPAGVPNRAYFPPATLATLDTPDRDLIVTEGEKKSAAADLHGFPCVGLTGVYAWQQKRKKDGRGRGKGRRELIPDLAAGKWDGRRAFIVFDSDAATNPDVRKAERLLADALARRRATVFLVRLPPGQGGAKQGLDDFLLAHGPDALAKLLAEASAEPAAGNDCGARLFRDPGELLRLARLKVDDSAAYAAERAWLKRLRVSMRDLDKALEPLVAELRRERRAEAEADPNRPPDPCPYFTARGQTWRRVQTSNGEVEVPLANFTATITVEVAVDDGADERRTFRVAG